MIFNLLLKKDTAQCNTWHTNPKTHINFESHNEGIKKKKRKEKEGKGKWQKEYVEPLKFACYLLKHAPYAKLSWISQLIYEIW